MKRDLYYVELVKFYYHDESDDEDVEDRNGIGYFTDEKIQNDAIKLCKALKEEGEEIVITKSTLDMNYNQKYIYVLMYEYSTKENEEYTDYYYRFEPMSNPKKCLEYKQKICNEPRYRDDGNRIFDDTPDGFYVKKVEINLIGHINYGVTDERINEILATPD